MTEGHKVPDNVVSLAEVRKARGYDTHVGGVLTHGECAHRCKWLVDKTDHSVECSNCKKQLDAFWCLSHLCQKDYRLNWCYMEARQPIEELMGRMQRLFLEMQQRVTPHRIVRLEKMIGVMEEWLRAFRRGGGV